MINNVHLDNCYSSGEDFNILSFFVGREQQIHHAVNSIRQNKLVIVDGYTMIGKTYFALKCLKDLSQQKDNSSLLSKHPDTNETYSCIYVNICTFTESPYGIEHIIKQILLGSEKFNGLISFLPDASLRREYILSAIALKSVYKGKRNPCSNIIEGHFELIKSILKVLYEYNNGKFPLVICLDNINALEAESEIIFFLEQLIKSGVRFLITQNTSLAGSSKFYIENQIRGAQVIQLGTMSQKEVNSIIHRIEQNILLAFSFNEKAKSMIYHLSGGIPYFVHYLCGGALNFAKMHNTTSIDENIITSLTKVIQGGLYPSLFETMFKAITESPKQLKMLKVYIDQPINETAFSTVISKDVHELPTGALIDSFDTFTVIANPPIQIYSRLRLGHLSQTESN